MKPPLGAGTHRRGVSRKKPKKQMELQDPFKQIKISQRRAPVVKSLSYTLTGNKVPMGLIPKHLHKLKLKKPWFLRLRMNYL